MKFNHYLKLALFIFATSAAVCFHLPDTAYSASGSASASDDFFEQQIRPLFVTNCQRCHNATKHMAGLDLSSAEGFARGSASGALVNKENPFASLLLKVISYDDELKMPPSGKLKDEGIAAMTAWVKLGAPWPGAAPTVAAAPVRSTVRALTAEEKNYWAFQPISHASAPKIKNTRWVKSPLDAFILQKLEAQGLKPAPPADKLTLLRRATFDLTGLPPTEKEMAEFLADKMPGAFQKVVERLLASPRYGEKWGRHWLDVARYADSTGNDEDHRYPFAWKYRDYVIEAFNQDLPYDQFVREQLAGDLLPAKETDGVNRRGIIATGFLALGPKALAQMDKPKMLYDVYDEQIDVTSRAFMGMTLACARCHNHKFDPLLTRDYYSFANIFASTRSFVHSRKGVSPPLEKPLVSKAEFDRYSAAKNANQNQQKRTTILIDELIETVKTPLAQQYTSRLAEFMVAARRVYAGSTPLADAAKQANLPQDVLQKWVNYLKPGDRVRGHLQEWHEASPDKLTATAAAYQQRYEVRLKEWNEKIAKWRVKYQEAVNAKKETVPDKPKFEGGEDRFFNEVYFGDGAFSITDKDAKYFSAEQQTQLKQQQDELARLKKEMPPEPDAACAVEDGEPVAQKVFLRGDYNNAGEDAPKAFPAILAPFDTKPEFTGSGRLQLADWLVRPEHPLTSRVMANRIWGWHFGEGLVRTPDNFGKTGERPSHPELLDWLAQQFSKSGWSLKVMHRMIMLSSTYQQAAVNPTLRDGEDGDNRLLSRFTRRRLLVEEARDALLAIDGTIDLTMGGTLQTGRGTDGENNQGRLSINPEKQKRRTVYLPLRRSNLPTLLNLFDFGDATIPSGKRQLTNVATQALFWLNSEFMTERAATVVKSLLAAEPSDSARINAAYQRILNRPPVASEVRMMSQYLAGYRQKFAGAQAEQQAWQSLCRALMASNDFLYVD